MMRNRSRLLGTAAACFVASVAIASPAASAQAADTAEAEAERGGLEDIVVTAQRREARLQDVPVSIVAITEEAAERMGIVGTESLAIATPSLAFTRGASNGGAPFLRGVGTQSAIAGNESPVAVYVDDIYIGVPAATLFNFNNIERVEVLKGPQGTLFGRNATAGVIHVQTKLPSQTPSVDIELGYANYDTISASAYATAGLGRDLAVSIAFAGSDQNDGWGRNLNNGQETQLGSSYGVRGKLLWTPGSTTVLLSADYMREKSDFGLNASIEPGSIGLDGVTGNGGRYNTWGTPNDQRLLRAYGVSAKLEQDFGAVRAVSISAYRKTEFTIELDQDNTPLAISRNEYYAPTRAFSQEFQLLSDHAGPVTWIVGAFYLSQIAQYDPLRVLGTSVAPNQFRDTRSQQHLRSYAGFGEVKLAVLPDTNVTVGARYTEDHYDMELRRFADGNPTGTPQIASAAFPKWTYRAILDHKLDDDVMIFGSYSRGFKSGGYNITSGGNPVMPEVLDAFEIGLKSELFDRKVRLNASAFYYDYSNLQVSIVNAGVTTTLNAASARFKGAEIDLAVAPGGGFTINGGLSVLDNKYVNFQNAPSVMPRPATCTPTPAPLPGPRTGGNMTCVIDASGNPTIRTPPFTASLGVNYNFTTSAGVFDLSGSFYHNSGFNWSVDGRVTQPSYELVNASLTWHASDALGVRLWVNNLFDAEYFSFKGPSSLADTVLYAPPRTYGATLLVHF